ncbi:hypothetical protein M2272_001338 [Mycobacterium frederiksbergense]|uniref:DUF4307 domain-containing protein n=1 Tax=Mycolicibacterium frederiksbergense TaxID=117567 RepID=A0ABT6KVH3_9MYCO|nr:MmpS family transport accessory protein [Mycolicibacterium frederiksbergense]MDH6194709.1 hypothetical protein [Mycolicibacterium frederiksbergense]
MNYPQAGGGWQQMPPPNMPPRPYPGQPYPGQPYTPGYYAPPPPPRKKTWLWVLLAFVTVIVLVVGGIVAVKLYANRDQTMTYEVTGTGATALVAYSDTRNGGDDPAEVSLPWTTEYTGKNHSVYKLQAKALADDTVTCKVSIGGKVVATDTQPSYRWASCLGRLSGR